MTAKPCCALNPLAATVRAAMPGACLAIGLLSTGAVQAATLTLPTIDVGAGLRSSFTSLQVDGQEDVNDFTLDNVRLYLNGKVNEQIKFTVNLDYNEGTDEVKVLDAIARFEYAPTFNIWAGRFLPPSDRANLYGAYYANHWSVYSDGVQDGYPSVYGGRDNGVAYWGDFADAKVKVSAGVFDVPETTAGATPTSKGEDTLVAARVQVNFWDAEPGYYLNGTYYGDKDILSVGVAGQSVGSDESAYSVDFLLEKKLPGGGVVSLESEYAKYDGLGGYQPDFESDGGYGLVGYLFPKAIGPGKIQLVGKYAKTSFDSGPSADFDQTTVEGNINYILKGFNARVGLFVKDTDFSTAPAAPADSLVIGVGLQLQI